MPTMLSWPQSALWWRHNDHAGVSNHQPHGCLFNHLFRRRSKKTSKLRVTGLCVGNSPGPVNSPHKGPVMRKMFPFDDGIMDNAVWSGKWKHIFIMTLTMTLTAKRFYCKTGSNSVQFDYTGVQTQLYIVHSSNSDLAKGTGSQMLYASTSGNTWGAINSEPHKVGNSGGSFLYRPLICW